MSMSSNNLRSSVLRRHRTDGDDSDPRVGLVNLADVMLVFACGLMLAIIANWNVDLNSVPSSGDTPSIKEIEGDLEAVEEGIAVSDGSYEQLGTVYRDEETGKLYVVTPEEQE